MTKFKPLLKLTHKHMLFIEAYTGPHLANATQSAIYAGYSKGNASTYGPTLLKDPAIQEEIKKTQEKQRKQANMKEEVHRELLEEVMRVGLSKAGDASLRDGLEAAKELAKMKGLYAATKQELTGANGTPVFGQSTTSPTTEINSPEELLEELEKIKKAVLLTETSKVALTNPKHPQQEN